ncbi:MAG: CAP domain-containing protein [Pseudomonadales bacterium]
MAARTSASSDRLRALRPMRIRGSIVLLLILALTTTSALADSAMPSLERDIRSGTLHQAGRDAADLARDPRLRAIARNHSAAMYRQRTLGHVLDDGVGPGERVARQHRSLFALIAENVAFQQHWPRDADLAARFVQSWMDSPGHRENILAVYQTLEVGCHGDRNLMFCTQLFARSTVRSDGEVPFRQPPGRTVRVRLQQPGAAERISLAPAGARPEDAGVGFDAGAARLPLPQTPGLHRLHVWIQESAEISRYAIIGGPYVCVTGRRDTVSDCGM